MFYTFMAGINQNRGTTKEPRTYSRYRKFYNKGTRNQEPEIWSKTRNLEPKVKLGTKNLQ